MESKKFLTGAFVRKNKILSFLENVRNTYKIPIQRIFVHAIEDNKSEYFVTFKLSDRAEMSKMNGLSIIHMKNGCIFSINALNKLIDSEKQDKTMSNDEYEIDWEKYSGNMIFLANGELRVTKINKVDNESLLR